MPEISLRYYQGNVDTSVFNHEYEDTQVSNTYHGYDIWICWLWISSRREKHRIVLLYAARHHSACNARPIRVYCSDVR